jgi:hypothetical protein
MVLIIHSSRQPEGERSNHPAGTQQIGECPQRGRGLRLWALDRIQVRPGRRDQTASPIWQDKHKLKCAMTMHPTQQRQGLAFERMPLQYDLDRRRKTIEVGSVAVVRSTLLTMSSCCERYDDTPTSGGSCCTWSAG